MLGLNYDSEEEEEAPAKEPAAAPKAAPKAAAIPGRQLATKEGPKPDGGKGNGKGAKGAGKSAARQKQIAPSKLKELCKEVKDAKSATAVVQASRKAVETSWDPRWGAEALYQIAKRSTARTRKEWAGDLFVIKLAGKLKTEVDSSSALRSGRSEADVDALLVALDGLRRMGFQDPGEQKEALEQAMEWMVTDNWLHPVKNLCRLYWLAAPLKLKGGQGESISALQAQLRSKALLMEGVDVALILTAMQQPGSRDDALLEKVMGRLKTEGIHSGMSVTDMVELAEGMSTLEQGHEEQVLRLLGQAVLLRKGELTPDESHRAHAAYSAMKLPLPKVWADPGAKRKREGGQIVTTTAFRPEEGHEKKRRGNHDIEKTSPPRVVRDMKMMSY